jgi:hypothetical protein
MRSIDSELLSRILRNVQSEQNNNAPSVDVIVSRASTPITRKEYWQESIVSDGVTATSTSVAVRKSGKKITDVYVAYVSGGTMTIKKSAFVLPVSKMTWTTVETIPNVVSCAIEFDGDFRRLGKRIEYRTDDEPMVIYTTASGALMAGILGETPETLANSGASNIDAVRGISSAYQDIDQGMVVFYIVSGTVYYRQYIGGVWEGQQTVSIAPANAVSIKAERLFDYRICLQVKDSAGALHEVFSKMEASGWNGAEFVNVNISQNVVCRLIRYVDQLFNEHITLGITQDPKRLYALSPVFVSASNIANGIGNYGFKILAKFDEFVFGEESNATAFTITDANNVSWGSTAIEKIDGKTLVITFPNFNNAVNPVSLSYTPGTMMGDVVPLEADSISFSATGLIPYTGNPPVPISINNSSQTEIIISFDVPISSASPSTLYEAFTVSGEEYNRIPDGELLNVQYDVESTIIQNGNECKLILVESDRMKNPTGNIIVEFDATKGNISSPDDSQSSNFNIHFVPLITAPVFNPNDVEHISVSISQAVVNRLVTYTSLKEEEYISVGLTQTNIVYHVDDIPT